MKQNVGQTDRLLRLLGGVLAVIVAVLVATGLVGPGTTPGLLGALLAAVIGIVLIGTAVFQRCLLYSLIGVDTSE